MRFPGDIFDRVNPADLAAPAAGACPKALGRPEADLTWLLHRAAQQLRMALEERFREHGLGGVRDYIVLTVLCSGEGLTQLALGQTVGLDKTTLTALIDRLERDGLVVRRIDPSNRRARIPEATPAGKALAEKLTETRQVVEASLLGAFTCAEQATLRALLVRFVGAGDHGEHLAGSCI